MNVHDVVERVEQIVDDGQQSGMWPSEADLEALLDELNEDVDDGDEPMTLCRLAVDELRKMTILASSGYGYWVQQQMGFFWLEMAVRAQL